MDKVAKDVSEKSLAEQLAQARKERASPVGKKSTGTVHCKRCDRRVDLETFYSEHVKDSP